MTPETTTAKQPTVASLNVKRSIAAPRDRVFAAFTTVEEHRKWFGPEDCQVLEGELDFRVGGIYRFSMQTDEYGVVDLTGEYREIIEGEKIVYTWRWTKNEVMDEWGEMLVTIHFRDAADGGTEIDLLHEGFPNEEVRDGHQYGWDGSFDKMDGCYVA